MQRRKEHVTMNNISTGVLGLPYGFWVSLMVLIVSIFFFFLLKKKMIVLNGKKTERQKQREKWNRLSKIIITIGGVSVIGIIGFGIVAVSNTHNQVTLEHIHGLDYKSDGLAIYIPAHDGLRVFKDRKWSIPAGEKHDYMGFSMVEDGFFSSGHPAADSTLADPLGIVKSNDYGKTIKLLDLYKENDFHGMTVGYHTKDIYVFNPNKNSKMNDAGFYYSTDETKTWNKSKLDGLSGQPTALAAHPTEKGVIAIGTDSGVYVSKDYGNTFEMLIANVNVTAVSFSHDNALLVGMMKGRASLLKFDLSTKKQIPFKLPSLGASDMIAYVKQNPKNKKEYVFATFEKNVFISKDDGTNWIKVVDKGVANNNS
jgi:photosystem II stability/assembly factor-like uncharacterized protein